MLNELQSATSPATGGNASDKHGKRGSHYLTEDVANRALDLVAPMIEVARDDRSVVGSGFLYVVVMDPALPPGEARFEDAVLCERAFGDPKTWDADYAEFARAKAKLTWRLGRDGYAVQRDSPHLLRAGDTLIAGAVCLDGIVVAVSGAFPEYDEFFAGSVAVALRALARKARGEEKAGAVLGES
ncbi:hypothetical protein [Propionivibrio soli]|uniref:hypothetical protein n=1 Tax=Propionivibrio soli TaxID=2976531 RepID=UPI0021E79D41|nr:hypothetical protein [Propionivibrio soli]